MRGITTALLALLLCSAALGSCGDDGDGQGRISEDEARERIQVDGPSPARVGTVERCKRAAASGSGISEPMRARLRDICENAASSGPDGITRATGRVCEEITKASVPKGSPLYVTAMNLCRRQQAAGESQASP